LRYTTACIFALRPCVTLFSQGCASPGGVLSGLRLAWSRLDPAEKVYVQHRLREEGPMIARLITEQARRFSHILSKRLLRVLVNGASAPSALWMQAAHVYVCGDGAAMAKGVRKAFIELLARHAFQIKPAAGSDAAFSSESITAAEELVTSLEKSGRYVCDSWS
jgi:sulfite reductase alpha subunit-like flavoprotein